MSIPLLTHIAAAAVAALAAWFFQDNRYSTELAELRLAHGQEITRLKDERAEADRIAGEEAKRIYSEMTDKYEGALNAARVRETSLRRDLAASGSELDRMREQNADAARRLAAAPPTAVAEYATAVGELLIDCSRRYQELAGKADGHASDVRAVLEAWPVIISGESLAGHQD